MCLESVNKKPKKHTVGYKIFKEDDDHFDGQIYETGPYYIGKTYDAKFGSEDLPYSVVLNDRKYLAGFHYYLKMKNAKTIALQQNEVVVRIKVKNILATGKQNGFDAGVSEFMTLHKLVFDANKDLKKEFFKVCCKGKVQQKIIQFAKDFQTKAKISTHELKKMANFVSESSDNFIDYICFVDCFPRRSECFKIFTKIHMWASLNHSEYKRHYHYVVKNSKELHDRLVPKNYTHVIYLSENIDKYILKM